MHHYSSEEKKSRAIDFKELFAYKDLFVILAYRDLKVRYAQTFLGLLWAILQPLLTLLIFTLVFGRLVKIDTGGIPYPLFAVCGMGAWSYFSFVLSQSGNSIIGAQDMIKKIYFPRLIIPLSKSLVGFVDFLVALGFILVLAIVYGHVPPAEFIYFPVFIFLAIISALAVGIWLSALTIRYRDFQHVVPFLVQFGLYATPVGYPSALILKNLPAWGGVIYYLNPMAGIADGFRWSLLGAAPPSMYSFISFGAIIILFITGLFYFKSVEKIMADIV